MDMPGAFKEAETPAPSLLPRYQTDIRDDERSVRREDSRYASSFWIGRELCEYGTDGDVAPFLNLIDVLAQAG